MDRVRLGRALSRLIDEQLIAKQEVAARAGVRPNTISTALQGKAAPRTYDRIARALGFANLKALMLYVETRPAEPAAGSSILGTAPAGGLADAPSPLSVAEAEAIRVIADCLLALVDARVAARLREHADQHPGGAGSRPGGPVGRTPR